MHVKLVHQAQPMMQVMLQVDQIQIVMSIAKVHGLLVHPHVKLLMLVLGP